VSVGSLPWVDAVCSGPVSGGVGSAIADNS
ncbi:uncharacterized protein METZ01_LOCUS42267, partial [marine metagenome]